MAPYDVMNGPAWSRAKHFRRSQSIVTATAASTMLVAVNPNRIGLIISCPNNNFAAGVSKSQMAGAVSTAATGVKLSYNVPGNANDTLVSASQFETTGTGVISNLQVVRSATTFNLGSVTTSGVLGVNFPLSPNDVVQWNCITPIAASVCDFTLGLVESTFNSRVTIGVNSPVAIDQGITLYAGSPPLVLWRDVIGDALTEDLFVISSTGNVFLGVWDIFY